MGLTAAFRMLVRVQDRCAADRSVFKVYVHLGELADWARDAGGTAGDFDSATFDVHREDQDDTRIFTVEVIRPAGRRTQKAELRYGDELGCGQITGIMFCFLLFLVNAGALAGWYFFPEKAESIAQSAQPFFEPLKPYTVEPLHRWGLSRTHLQYALGGVALLWLILLLTCCRACRCCRCSCMIPSRRVMCCEGGSRPLMCHYTLLEPSDSVV